MRLILLILFLALGFFFRHAPALPETNACAWDARAYGGFFEVDDDDGEDDDDDEEEDDDDGEDDDDDDGEDDDDDNDHDDGDLRGIGGNLIFGWGFGGGGGGGGGGFAQGQQNGRQQGKAKRRAPNMQRGEIDVKELPDKVIKAVERAYPNAKKESAEKFYLPGQKPKLYAVVMKTADGKRVEVTVSPKGAVLKRRFVRERK